MRQEETFVVERVLNNNVVIAFPKLRNADREHIVIGKGIGFGCRRGSEISMVDPRVEKLFSLVMEEHQSHFHQLFATVSPEVIGLTEEIILFATKTLNRPLHEHIHVALADHIGFAITRLNGGINIENPFLEEIRALYPREWAVAAEAGRWIENRFGVPIPEEEVGLLTLHIHSATHTRGLSETMRVTNTVNMAIQIIEEDLHTKIRRDELNYARMVIHLRFAVQRLLRKEPIHNPLADAVKEKLPLSYAVAERVAQKVGKQLGLEFPPDEVSYLAIHVGRLTNQA